MNELEPLAKALRKELGSPPEAWVEAQRTSVRGLLRTPPRPRTRFVVVPAVAALLALAGTLLWLIRPPPSASNMERWLVAEELREPLRLPDGSSISLESGARGRLSAAETSVRFDLHGGRARFDVTPNPKRQWSITAGKNEVRVLGTRFSVFYGGSETFDVDVERGVVSVNVADRSSAIQLEAGDHLEGRPGHVVLTPKAPPPSPSALASITPEPSAAKVSASAPSAVVRPSPVRDEWQARFREGKYVEALRLARKSGIDTRLNELPPNTLAELADVARLGGDPELAVRALKRLLQQFPASSQTRDGHFLLGRVHVLRGDSASAIAAFERHLQSDRTALYSAEALGRLMELYSKGDNSARARAMAKRYLEQAPNGPYQRLAHSLLAQPN